MKTFVGSLLVGLICVCSSKHSPAHVQVYSRTLGEFGKANTLVCHVSRFHPPDITVELLKGRRVMDGAVQSDLAFEENWHYHLTKHANFTPNHEDEFACRVTHMGKANVYVWEPDM